MIKQQLKSKFEWQKPLRVNFFYIQPLSILSDQSQDEIITISNDFLLEEKKRSEQQNSFNSRNSKKNPINQVCSNTSVTSQFFNLIEIKKSNYLDDYIFLSNIGKGSFGKVSKLKQKSTSKIYASKRLHRVQNSRLNQIKIKRFKQQIQTLCKVQHTNIVTLKNVYYWKNQFTFIMEYFPGKNLHQLHKSNTPPNQQTVAKIMYQIINALQYLHGQSIVHHDIKPQNILYSLENEMIKIVDFGEAVKLQQSFQYLDNMGGTMAYFAPETFQGYCSPKTDIWACGLILYYLLSGRLYFYDSDNDKMKENIINQQLVFEKTIWEMRSAEVRLLIMQMLQKQPEKRISTEQALKSKWFQKHL